MSYILRDENALFYESGFSCDNAFFLHLDKEKFFITDSRYITEAKEEVKEDIEVVDGGRDLLKKVREICRNKRVKRLVFDPNDLSLNQYEGLKKLNIFLKKEKDFSHKKRIIKTEEEIKILREAARLGAKKFDEFALFLQGKTNLNEKELFFEATSILKDRGSLSLSFDPIVAVEENASKPHSLPTSTILKTGDLILVDAGIKYKRYCSDRTRVVEFGKNIVFGKNQTFKDKEKQKIYDVVLKANLKAISMVKPGVKASEIDKAARDVIEEAGYGKYFIHSTGHGVGLDIHEMPYISKTSKTVLQEGMVFTIEPGIYIPKSFGVRIEDMVVVTKTGCDVL